MKNAKCPVDNCTHCGACTNSCGFLDKYHLDLASFADRPDLAYHCFLCGACAMICPNEISGRHIALNNRKNTVKQKGSLRIAIQNFGVYLEKNHYLFKSYPKTASESVLFFGCNFPAYYPVTTKKIAALFKARADIDSVFDCCGKPLEELGLEKQCGRLLSSLNRRLKKRGISEIITLCPNCFDFLSGRLDVKVVNIYEKIEELGLEVERVKLDVHVFVPCPDKKKQTLLHQIERLCQTNFKQLNDIQCCGSGGCAIKKEPDLAEKFRTDLQRKAPLEILLYCATCAGRLKTQNYNVRHFCAELFGTLETPDSKNSFRNRFSFKFYHKRRII